MFSRSFIRGVSQHKSIFSEFLLRCLVLIVKFMKILVVWLHISAGTRCVLPVMSSLTVPTQVIITNRVSMYIPRFLSRPRPFRGVWLYEGAQSNTALTAFTLFSAYFGNDDNITQLISSYGYEINTSFSQNASDPHKFSFASFLYFMLEASRTFTTI
jgi:hypothetical protein